MRVCRHACVNRPSRRTNQVLDFHSNTTALLLLWVAKEGIYPLKPNFQTKKAVVAKEGIYPLRPNFQTRKAVVAKEGIYPLQPNFQTRKAMVAKEGMYSLQPNFQTRKAVVAKKGIYPLPPNFQTGKAWWYTDSSCLPQLLDISSTGPKQS